MPKVIAIHSFRRGAGKSNLTANLAALLAAEGRRLGLVDADLEAPSQRTLFGLAEAESPQTLNDYLLVKCDIQQAAYDVTPRLGANVRGQLYLVPASEEAREMARIMRDGFDVTRLNDGLQKLAGDLKLEMILVDTHAGLNEETLRLIALADVLALILRHDQRDYQGAAVTVDVARRLEVPRIAVIVNETPAAFPPAEVKAKVEETYHCEVAGILPYSDDMLTLAGSGLFARRYPNHPVTATLKHIAAALAS